MSLTESWKKIVEKKEDNVPTEETVLGKMRRNYKLTVPELLKDLSSLSFSEGEKTKSESNQTEIKKLFPLTYGRPIINISSEKKKSEKKESKSEPIIIGVVLSGGQASGGHNVITGLFDALKELNPKNRLIGFKNGPIGVMKNKFKELDAKVIDLYRNTGGFDMICAGRDKIEKPEQKKEALDTVNKNNLDGLIVIGGDDSNTNAAVLAEYFEANKSKCVVVGIPKTIDGDLQNKYIEISFGFDTAVKTYSEMISNICRDSMSARKAWHFIKLMGRDASHVTLDCAITTHPNITLIGEEVEKENLLLHDVTENICNIIVERAVKKGKNYGTILIPEGIISFIPSMKVLINTLTEMLKIGSPHLKKVEEMVELSDKIKYVRNELSKESKTSLQNFDVLPRDIQAQLLLERDPHGNVQMSQIPIENLFILICQQKLKKNKEYSENFKFRGQGHFFGYDGRSCFPTNFDSHYCYSLGRNAAFLVSNKYNGYMSRVYDLHKDVSQWKAGAIPITMLMNMELRHGKMKPVIKKCLVDVEEGNKFDYFNRNRDDWAINDLYRFTGPIQFYGPKELTHRPPYNVLFKNTGHIKWPCN